jgi:hypothetical protein
VHIRKVARHGTWNSSASFSLDGRVKELEKEEKRLKTAQRYIGKKL